VPLPAAWGELMHAAERLLAAIAAHGPVTPEEALSGLLARAQDLGWTGHVVIGLPAWGAGDRARRALWVVAPDPPAAVYLLAELVGELERLPRDRPA